jgi:hypothetical protein
VIREQPRNFGTESLPPPEPPGRWPHPVREEGEALSDAAWGGHVSRQIIVIMRKSELKLLKQRNSLPHEVP